MGAGAGVGVGVYSGCQCKFNSFCGMWSKEFVKLFHYTGKSTVSKIYLHNPLKTDTGKKKI